MKGMKVQSSTVYFDDEHHEYTIRLNKERGVFFIDSEGALFDVLSSQQIEDNTWESYRQLSKDLEKAVDSYIESKIEKLATETKVILFTMKMGYNKKDYDNEYDSWEILGERDDLMDRDDAPSLKFGYKVAVKVELDGEVVRYYPVNNKDHTISCAFEYDEIIWSQEAEDLFKDLKKGLIDLCYRLDNFFGERNDKVLENLENLTGKLLELK